MRSAGTKGAVASSDTRSKETTLTLEHAVHILQTVRRSYHRNLNRLRKHEAAGTSIMSDHFAVDSDAGAFYRWAVEAAHHAPASLKAPKLHRVYNADGRPVLVTIPD